MTSRDFCYWLQGYFEIHATVSGSDCQTLLPSQVDMIKRHLAMVFVHEIDPSIDGGNQQTKQKLQEIHDGHSHLFDKDILLRC